VGWIGKKFASGFPVKANARASRATLCSAREFPGPLRRRDPRPSGMKMMKKGSSSSPSSHERDRLCGNVTASWRDALRGVRWTLFSCRIRPGRRRAFQETQGRIAESMVSTQWGGRVELRRSTCSPDRVETQPAHVRTSLVGLALAAMPQ